MIYFYAHHDNIFKLNEKYQTQRLDKMLSEYSKQSRSVRETEDHYREQNKYLKSQLIERIKLFPRKKRVKTGIETPNKDFHQTSSTISTNKAGNNL